MERWIERETYREIDRQSVLTGAQKTQHFQLSREWLKQISRSSVDNIYVSVDNIYVCR